ncbi:transposase-like protein [Pseudoxanthomonas broegbernensis]|nr:transposase-like protein [Pseudoxanthomonas broegbernensis]
MPVAVGGSQLRCARRNGLLKRILQGRLITLRQANEILRKASAYFAQAELDRRFKP